MTETFISAHLLLGGGGYAEMRDGIAEAVLEMDWGAGGREGCSAVHSSALLRQRALSCTQRN